MPDSGQVTEPTNAFVRAGPMLNLPALLRSFGVKTGPVFAGTGIEVGDFNDPDTRLPYLGCTRLLARCAEATGCGHFGLLLGQTAEPTYLGMPGYLAHSAPTVEQALKALVDFLDLHDTGGSAYLDRGAEYSSFGYRIVLPEVTEAEQVYDLSAAMICKTMRLLCEPDWAPVSVNLARREPRDRRPYRLFFRSPIFFDASVCELTFTNHCLVRVPPTSDTLLYRHILQEAEYLHELHRGESLQALPALLQRGLLTGRFSAPEIAGELGIHERTLHRRLSTEGTNFRHQLDAARRSLSERLLASTDRSVGEIAVRLGYADASGFIRAFERWHGVSPASWRRQNADS